MLSDRDIVILDGGNYIKGWRYQLWCEAKAVRTTCCVVHVGTSVEQARTVNQARIARQEEGGAEGGEEERSYERECWENLVFRYEEPNPFARWDSPLFTVVWDDAEPPYTAIWDALLSSSSKTVKPNAATVLKTVAPADYLHTLDKTTSSILSLIMQWTSDHPGEGGGRIDVGEGDEELVVELPGSAVGLPALQRLRRGFIQANRREAVGVVRVRESFVGWLNDAFEKM